MSIATPMRSDEVNAILEKLPNQGNWTDEEYLSLTDYTTRLVEFTDGYLEPLPMPTDLHHSVLQFMFLALTAFLPEGKVFVAGIRMRVRRGKYREPDVIAVKDANDKRRRNRFWLGADFNLEVVSEDKPERDLVDKVKDYAEAKVPEYWIVNPQTETITVLTLRDGAYAEHGVFVRGQVATSVIFPGFSVKVDDVFNVDRVPDDPEDELVE
jgi:Uma2 family endonuclease